MDLLMDENHLRYYNQDIFAKMAVSSLSHTLHSEEPYKNLFHSRDILLKQHPNNVVVRNAIDYFLYQFNPGEEKERHHSFLRKLTESNDELARLASKKIRPGGAVLVHSINNQITHILEKARKYKKFDIHVLEHHPFEFGKKIDKKFKGVRVFHDLEIKKALKHVDTVFIGGDAILRDSGAKVKHGSTIISENTDAPVYVCAHSWKYDHANLHMKEDEVYEYLDPKHITAFICEHGIFRPKYISREINFHNRFK